MDEDVPDGPPPLPGSLEAGDEPSPEEVDEPSPETGDAEGGRRRGTAAASVVAGVVGVALVVGVGGVAAWRLGTAAADGLAAAVWGTAVEDTIVIDAAEFRTRTDASCERLAGARGPEPEQERTHLDDDEAAELTADDLYELRPPHSGRHLGRFLPLPVDAYDRPVDERALVHNLEHGAVAVLYDPSALSDEDVAALEAWVRERNAAGFHDDAERTGAAIVAAPVEPGSVTSGAAVAFRAWGVATDCDGFDQVIADGFVASHFGTRGVAPEGFLAPYPSGAVELLRPDV